MESYSIKNNLSESQRETSLYKPYRELIAPSKVKELSKLKPHIAVLHVLWFWFGILMSWVLVYNVTTWWALLIAIPVIGTRFYGLYIIGHDGMHRRIFNNQKLNDRFTDLFIFAPVGAITRINNKNHLLHHQHLGTEFDPDRPKHACFNKSTKWEFIFFFTGLLTLLRTLNNVYLSKKKEGKTLNSREKRIVRHTIIDIFILLAWQTMLIGGLTYFFGWWGYPVLWLLPVYLFTYLGDLARSFLEHAQPMADHKADKHRLITFESNVLEKIFLAPCNMNYHAAHHLWTSIPYYNLPAADRELKKHPDSKNLEWRKSYLSYAWYYFTKLPLPECRSSKS